jgi:multidrug resistance protein MdtO
MVRSPHISYVGAQVALAFYLVAFQSFSAPVAMAPARDRVVGVGLGLVVMWFIFDQIWPVRTVTAMRRGLASLLRETGRLFHLSAKQLSEEKRTAAANELRYSVGVTMLRMREMHEAVGYEFGVDREAHLARSEDMMQAAIAVGALFWSGLTSVPLAARDAALAANGKILGENLKRIAERYDEVRDTLPATPEKVVDLSFAKNGPLRIAALRYLELCAILPDPHSKETF